MGYSIGIGLTNDCDLHCAHCYRDTSRIDKISLEQIKQICRTIPVESMGMGTGENGLHPEFVPADDPIGRLPISLISRNLIEPLLGIADQRKDKRIDFIGGGRGLGELARRVRHEGGPQFE